MVDGDKLAEHCGHKIACVAYGIDDEDGGEMWSVAIECETCNEVLVECNFDSPEIEEPYYARSRAEDVICERCDWSGISNSAIPLQRIASVILLLKPGQIIPHGACPHCGAFVYAAWRPM